MTVSLLLIGIGAFVMTLLGGFFAIKFRDKLHLVLGFSAGAVVAVAFFDLLPEALELGEGSIDAHGVMTIAALGFVIYMILDRIFIGHGHNDDNCENEHHNTVNSSRQLLGAGSLALHSFLDGVAIGFAFQVSSAVGFVVTFAVLVHDFSDGINTVSMVLRNQGTKQKALRWVFIGAIAPTIGIFSTFLFTVQEKTLSIILAIFCGFFLYIGASDLLPESHHKHPTYWTTIATVLGMGVLYAVISIAGH